MLRRLRKWRALPKTERNTLLTMMFALPFLEIALRLFGYGRTRRWIEQCTRQRAATANIKPDVIWCERLAQLAAIAGEQGLIQATCLRQSLLVYGMLRWRGLTPDLVIGVQPTRSMPNMHAWVILDGAPLGQGTLQHVPFSAPSNGLDHPASLAKRDRSTG
jgi:hypothetical protein